MLTARGRELNPGQIGAKQGELIIVANARLMPFWGNRRPTGPSPVVTLELWGHRNAASACRLRSGTVRPRGGGNQVSLCQRLFSVVAGLVATAAVTVGLVGCSGGSPPVRRSGLAITSVPGKLTSAQRTRLEHGISAPAVGSQAAVIAAEVRVQFINANRSMLPSGSRVRISTTTFRATSAGTATVDAVVSGPTPGRWRLLLIREGGQWLLIGTRKLP